MVAEAHALLSVQEARLLPQAMVAEAHAADAGVLRVVEQGGRSCIPVHIHTIPH